MMAIRKNQIEESIVPVTRYLSRKHFADRQRTLTIGPMSDGREQRIHCNFINERR